MRLGRVPVGGLQRDETAVNPVPLQAQPQAAIRFAGGNAQQPAIRLEPMQQIEHPFEQRLLDFPARAHEHWRPIGSSKDRTEAVDYGRAGRGCPVESGGRPPRG